MLRTSFVSLQHKTATRDSLLHGYMTYRVTTQATQSKTTYNFVSSTSSYQKAGRRFTSKLIIDKYQSSC